jgi:hypothetical protein
MNKRKENFTEYLANNLDGYAKHYLNDKLLVSRISDAANEIHNRGIQSANYIFYSKELAESKEKGKQIFSDIDPYGEENWE